MSLGNEFIYWCIYFFDSGWYCSNNWWPYCGPYWKENEMTPEQKFYLIVCAICFGIPFAVLAYFAWKLALTVLLFVMVVIGGVSLCCFMDNYVG